MGSNLRDLGINGVLITRVYQWKVTTLIGVVYMTLCVSLKEVAIAYSATTVLPAEV